MRIKGRPLMSLCITAVGAAVVVQALAWPFKTALFPLIVGFPVFFLGLADFFLSAFADSGGQEQSIDFKLSEGTEAGVERRRTFSIFGWILAFFFLTILVGFPIAVPAFVFGYLKIQGKEKWGMTVIVTAVAWAAFFGLFVWFLNVPFGEGYLQPLFHLIGL